MKSTILHNLMIILISALFILLVGSIDSLPWWCTVFPPLLLGVATDLLKWPISAFFAGFVSGFIVWAGLNVYLDISYSGDALNRIALLFTLPKWILIIGAGSIGGLITGVAFYTGKSRFSFSKIATIQPE